MSKQILDSNQREPGSKSNQANASYADKYVAMCKYPDDIMLVVLDFVSGKSILNEHALISAVDEAVSRWQGNSVKGDKA